MKPQSRHLIHVGINFVMVPAPSISKANSLQFQQAILSEGLDFQRVETPGSQLVVTRDPPSPLRIAVGIFDPQNSQVGQILVIAEQPKSALSLFIQETEAALTAFGNVWS